jgi:hypothetical protein
MLVGGGNSAWAVNNSLIFNGSDYVEVKKASEVLPIKNESRTVSAWIKPTNNASNWGNILTYGTGDCNGKMWGLGRQSTKLAIWGGV